MEKRQFDYMVNGGGSAGYAAARTARGKFEKVAIIDDAEELGGLCILRDSMPSKTLIYSTEVLHLAREGGKFGLNIPEAKADMRAMHAPKFAVIGEFSSYRKGQLESDRFHLLRDRAVFVDDRTVSLTRGGGLVTADHFMIATGSSVNIPDVRVLRETPHWTSDEVLDLDFLPVSVIVLGGGVVACALTQFLSRIGSRVTQIQRSLRILSDGSAEAAEVVIKAFRDEGIALHTDTALESVAKEGDEYVVRFTEAGEPREVRAAHLLNALGRKSNSGGL
jgi:pyruvate/2-oxoglutarate dehydrogenase complex dihydrolipoamide dehydrogenase (E3) component